MLTTLAIRVCALLALSFPFASAQTRTVDYTGPYELTQKPPRFSISYKNAQPIAPKRIAGTIAFHLVFDGDSVTGRYSGDQGLNPADLAGKVENGICTLQLRNEKSIWTGPCNDYTFEGTLKNDPHFEGHVSTRTNGPMPSPYAAQVPRPSQPQPAPTQPAPAQSASIPATQPVQSAAPEQPALDHPTYFHPAYEMPETELPTDPPLPKLVPPELPTSRSVPDQYMPDGTYDYAGVVKTGPVSASRPSRTPGGFSVPVQPPIYTETVLLTLTFDHDRITGTFNASGRLPSGSVTGSVQNADYNGGTCYLVIAGARWHGTCEPGGISMTLNDNPTTKASFRADNTVARVRHRMLLAGLTSYEGGNLSSLTTEQKKKYVELSDQVLQRQSKYWAVNRYHPGNVIAAFAYTFPEDPDRLIIHTEYHYASWANPNEKGWMELALEKGDIQCVRFHDGMGCGLPIPSEEELRAQLGVGKPHLGPMPIESSCFTIVPEWYTYTTEEVVYVPQTKAYMKVTKEHRYTLPTTVFTCNRPQRFQVDCISGVAIFTGLFGSVGSHFVENINLEPNQKGLSLSEMQNFNSRIKNGSCVRIQ